MEVILITDVEKLGKQGDKVKVKDGYGRNFLIPNKQAVVATAQTLKMVEKLKIKRELEEKKIKDEAEKLKVKVESLSITIAAEAGEEDKLFGTITHDMIKDALAIENIIVDKRKISIEETIKKLGVYDINIKFHPEVMATVRIWVVKK
ncbi:MAG: 50S ribosomal protein L9 [Candidatus Omnitrophica bacterium]|nr:50S ribosomal protein L9 [Candidatus Omnitrophota bacterium]